MKKDYKMRERGKQFTAFFLIMVTMLFLIIPQVHAESHSTLNIHRYDGSNRENVAENVARAHFSNSNKVILVNRAKFPDAISATNISQGRYPVLYTHEGHVTEDTIRLIQSMPLDEIYILGGESSIRPSVMTQLKNATGVEVTRVTGSNRYEANVNAVRSNFNQKNHVVIASGEVYADALYGVSYANTIDAPVILTNKGRLQAPSVQLLRDLNVQKATIIGGPYTVTQEVKDQLSQMGIASDRIAGQNRYIGSAEVALASYTNPRDAVIASGEVFSDALVSAPLAQKLDAPILLVRSNRMHDKVESYLTNNLSTIRNIYIQGGPRTIEPSLIDTIFQQKTEEQSGRLEIEFDMDVFNQEVLTLVNEERARLGTEPLYYESTLQTGVDLRTLDSISVQTLFNNHARPDGSDWSTAFNYLEGTGVFASGENIAYNWITYDRFEKMSQTYGALEAHFAQIFYDQYANSTGHYNNMINAGFDGMAVSTMFADHGDVPGYMRVYNTMVFSINY